MSYFNKLYRNATLLLVISIGVVNSATYLSEDIVGSTTTPRSVYAVRAGGSEVVVGYIDRGTSHMEAYSVTGYSKASPQNQLSSIRSYDLSRAGQITEIAAPPFGTKFYVAASKQFHVFDGSSVAGTSITSDYDNCKLTQFFQFNGALYWYLGCGKYLVIIKDDGTGPFGIAATPRFGEVILGIAISGDTLFLAFDTNVVRMYSLSIPESPSDTLVNVQCKRATGLCVDQGQLYCSHLTGYNIWKDILTMNPTPVPAANPPACPNSGPCFTGINVHEGYVYLADVQRGLLTVNISTGSSYGRVVVHPGMHGKLIIENKRLHALYIENGFYIMGPEIIPTPAPDTLAPPTPAPDTLAPPTPLPTAAPTLVPVTPVPIKATPVPVTPVPVLVTPTPNTNIPLTDIPQVIVPTTGVPTAVPVVGTQSPTTVGPSMIPSMVPTPLPSVEITPLPIVINITDSPIIETPIPTIVEIENKVIIQSASGITVLASAIGVGSGLGGGMRMIAISMSCDHSEFLPDALHPTQWSIRGSQSLGMVVFASILVTSSTIIFILAVVFLNKYRHVFPQSWINTLDNQGLLRCPSAPYFVFYVLYQGTTLSAARLAIQSSDVINIIVGSLVLIICSVIPVLMYKKVLQGVPDKAKYINCDPGTRTTLTKLIVGPGEWVSMSRSEHWVCRYRSILGIYKQRLAGYGLVESTSMLVISIISALPSEGNIQCGHVRVALCLIHFILLTAEIVSLPHVRFRDSTIDFVILSSQGTSLSLFAVSSYINDPMSWSGDVANRLLTLATACLFIKTILDIGTEIYIFATDQRNILQEACWTTGDGVSLETLDSSVPLFEGSATSSLRKYTLSDIGGSLPLSLKRVQEL